MKKLNLNTYMYPKITTKKNQITINFIIYLFIFKLSKKCCLTHSTCLVLWMGMHNLQGLSSPSWKRVRIIAIQTQFDSNAINIRMAQFFDHKTTMMWWSKAPNQFCQWPIQKERKIDKKKVKKGKTWLKFVRNIK